MTEAHHKETLANIGTKFPSTTPDTNPEFVPSTSDERVVNNVMRHEYRVLDDQEKFNMKLVKDAGLNFVTMCDHLGESRELSLAKTKIEEAVFWVVKHITRGP
jgi:hypothetical protein